MAVSTMFTDICKKRSMIAGQANISTLFRTDGLERLVAFDGTPMTNPPYYSCSSLIRLHLPVKMDDAMYSTTARGTVG